MMRWAVPVMASIRCSTRCATKTPPPMPSTTTTRSTIAPPSRRCRPTVAVLEVASDQKQEATGEFGHKNQRAVVRTVLIVKPPVGGFRPACGSHHPRRQRADIAGDPHPGRGGHEIEVGARPQRPIADGEHQAVQAAPVVDLGDLADLGIHRGSDLLGDQARVFHAK